jgi:hypothetical protein
VIDAAKIGDKVMVEEAIRQIAKRSLKDNPQIKEVLRELSENDPLMLSDKVSIIGGNTRYIGKEQIGRIRKAIEKL